MPRTFSPFSNGLPLGRDQLERYVQGSMTEAERHAVEMHLEHDPLLREALEGLQQPGAWNALHDLRKPDFRGGARWKPFLFVAAVLVTGAGAYLLLRPANRPIAIPEAKPVALQVEVPPNLPTAVESTLQVVHAEIATASRQHQSDKSFTAKERFHLDTAPMPRQESGTIEKLETQPVAMDRTTEPAGPLSPRHSLGSRNLIFLHHLKLVRPEDLQAARALRLHSPGIPANMASAAETPVTPMVGSRSYLDFMDGVMAAVARGDDRSALDGLYQVLDEYPDDVNAQFYAGLACYRTGLYKRGQHWFRAAAINPVDSFVEEARWYEALSMLKVDGKEMGRSALEQIAAEGGFYAQQAAKELEVLR